MGRAWVLGLGLTVMGLGIAVCAGDLSGSWEATVCLGFEAAPTHSMVLDDGWSFLEVDYDTGNWVFGGNATLDPHGIDALWFTASGSLGAFTTNSLLAFDPQAARLAAFDTVVDVFLAGVDLYGMWNLGRNGRDIAVGAAIGGIGRVGQCTIGIEADFGGIFPNLWYVYLWGPAFALYPYDGWEVCPGLYYAQIGWWIQSDCRPGLSTIEILAVVPLTCLTATAIVDFDCATGFDSACFHFFDIDLGVGWFELASLSICFQTESKTICADLDLVLGGSVCVTPYFDIRMGSGLEVEGLELNALSVVAEFDGVTLKAGEILDRRWELDDPSLLACDNALYGPYTWYFTRDGTITYSNYGSSCTYSVWESDVEHLPNEMLGLSIDGRSCGAGAFDVDVYGFFIAGDPSAYGIFGWIGTHAQITIDVGPNASVGFAIEPTFLGLHRICLSVGALW